MLSELIRKRRSIHPPRFNQKPIPREELEEILEVANWAPTHKKTQPWLFKVMHSEKSRNELGNFLAETYKSTTANFKENVFQKMKSNPQKSSAVIAICMQRNEDLLPEWEEIAAVSMAVQNMWLLCTEKNIGTYWSSPKLISQAQTFFELAENQRCLGFLYMGYYDEEPPNFERESWKSKVEWI